MLVLLHGLGSDEQDLISLAPQLDPRLMVAAIRAPYRYGMGGYAWFDVQWTANERTIDVSQAATSLATLAEFLPELVAELGTDPAKLILGGFSQGGMMTLAVALNNPGLLAGAMILSGRVLPPFVPAEPPVHVQHLPFLVQHGTYDPVLTVEDGREVRDLLTTLDAPMQYHEYPMGHEVSLQSLMDAQNWLYDQIS
jgi:phospholipase/carboxylesterase